jgi:hypothetical protein
LIRPDIRVQNLLGQSHQHPNPSGFQSKEPGDYFSEASGNALAGPTDKNQWQYIFP